jgi:translation initiation factor IF-3
MAKDLEEQAEVQQAPKREGRNMIMFLTPRKTPLVKKEQNNSAPVRTVRTISTPPRSVSTKIASSAKPKEI